jgi:hypothetical protein
MFNAVLNEHIQVVTSLQELESKINAAADAKQTVIDLFDREKNLHCPRWRRLDTERTRPRT